MVKLDDKQIDLIADFGIGSGGLLAKMLLAERAEREKNPGVWDRAPEWADRVRLEWNASIGGFATTFQTYTRTLPKTKAREIAEKWAGVPTPTPTRPYLADIIESAILEVLATDGKK